MFLTDAAHPTPHPSRFARHLPLKGKAFGLCESLLHSKSQRTPPLASNIGLLVLVHPPVGRVVMILFLFINYSNTGKVSMGASPVSLMAASASVAVILELITANFLSESHTLSSLARAVFALASHLGQPSNT